MYALFDIGGTKTRVALSYDLTTLKKVEKFDTPLLYAEGIAKLSNTIRELSENKKLTAIAGGIRGPLNRTKTGITKETKLMDWVGRNIVADLTNTFHTDVFLENDTAVVGLGEVTFGAGKGSKIVAYHTVSTGVGGARFVHGVLDEASVGFEPGHQVLDIDRTVLGRHTKPTLENLVSGSALEERRGVKPYEIPQDDTVWNELAKYLATGLKNTILYWSPDTIVLGGSMIVGDPRIEIHDIRRHTEAVLDGFVPCPEIKKAELGDNGGLYGAMALLAQKQ